MRSLKGKPFVITGGIGSMGQTLVRRGGCYAVLPMLPELRDPKSKESNALTREFSSADSVLDLAATSNLLRRHGLLNGGAVARPRREILR